MPVTPDSPIAELKLSRNLTDLLSRYNYGTVGTLIARPRTAIAARLPMAKDLDAIDAALTKHGLWYRSEVGEWGLWRLPRLRDVRQPARPDGTLGRRRPARTRRTPRGTRRAGLRRLRPAPPRSRRRPRRAAGGERTMSAAYVRGYYGVPAKRGMRITIDGRPATIVGFAGARLRIRRDGEKRTAVAHPTWRVEYPKTEETTR